MVAGSSKSSIVFLSSQQLGITNLFYRRVTIPQSFIFVFLIFLGSVMDQSVAGLTSKLCVVSYLLAANLMVRSRIRSFTPRLLLLHVTVIILLLVSFAQVGKLEPTLNVYLPVALVFASLSFLPLSAKLLPFCLSPSFFIIVVYSLLVLVDPTIIPLGGLYGPLLVVFGALIALVSTIFGRERASIYQGRDSLSFGGDIKEPSAEHTEVLREQEEILSQAQRVVAEETISEFGWRLPVITIITGGLVFAAGWILELRVASFTIAWLFGAIFQLILYYRMVSATKVSTVFSYGVFIILGAVFWWAILAFYNSGPSFFIDLLLVFLILGYGSLPWPGRVNLIMSTLFFFAVAIRIPGSDYPLLLGFFAGSVLFYATRSAALHYLTVMSRIAIYFIAESNRMSTFPSSMLRVLVSQLTNLCDSDRALVLYGNRKAEILSGIESSESEVDQVYDHGFMQLIGDTGQEEGVLGSDRLGEQFRSPLVDWFGFVPNAFVFSQFITSIDGREDRVTIVIPCSVLARIVTYKKVLRSVVGLSSMVRLSLSSTRTRLAPVGPSTLRQQTLSRREVEFNQVVHDVNNLVQDISVQCDRVRLLVSELSGDHSQEEIIDEIRKLDGWSHVLASEVSDVKLLRELSSISVKHRSEHVPLEPLIRDLESFGSYWAYRSSGIFVVDIDASDKLAVRVVSREYLETCLHVLLRLSARHMNQEQELRLEIRDQEKFVHFDVSFEGRQISSIITGDEEEGAETIDISGVLMPVRNFIEKSGGMIDINRVDQRTTFLIKLRKGDFNQKELSVGMRWILLVEDNEEVTTFYSRIAEVLNLEHEAASSVEEAMAVIEKRGEPCLVITDMQLRESSGVDLILLLRQRYGESLPVLVVSGDESIETEETALRAGASKYLSKPVGRRKLFAEIQRTVWG